MKLEVESAQAMMNLGERIGALCSGGEVIELVGDIGAGKTTFVKGLATALEIDDDVQSPTFTISRVYETAVGLRLAHYDFYRLHDPGVMAIELAEAAQDPHTITVVEWAEGVSNVLPGDRLRVLIQPTAEDQRKVEFEASTGKGAQLLRRLA